MSAGLGEGARPLPTPGSAGWARGVRAAWRREGAYALALAPAALLVGLFFVFPALWAVRISLTDLGLVQFGGGANFVGLENYRQLLRDPDFPLVLRASIGLVLGSAVVGQVGLGLALALLVDRAEAVGLRLAPLAYGAVLMAWVSPLVVAGFVWLGMFAHDGTLSRALAAVGLGPVTWLGDQALGSVIIADVWRGTGFALVVFLGALRTVPPELYEAARVDGAGAWRRLRDHTLPMLAPTAAVALLWATIATLGSFALILTLTNGGPGGRTSTLAVYAYQNAFGGANKIGYGSAIAVVMLGLNLAFAIVYTRLARGRA